MTKKNNNSLVGTMFGNMIGVGMIGATASMVNQMPAGTAKDIAGVVPVVQSAALVSHNLKFVNSTMGKQNHLYKSKGHKSLW